MIVEILIVVIIGGLTGVLINYLADVLPVSTGLSMPACNLCDYKFSLKEYLSLTRCPEHHPRKIIRSIVIILLTGGLFLFLWLMPDPRVNFILAALMFAFFELVVIIDLEHRLVLRSVSLVGLIICSIAGYLLHGLLPTLIGGVAGFGLMLILYFLGEAYIWLVSRLRKQKVDEVALGFGDVSLSTIIGLLLGWPGIIAGLILTIILGGVVSLVVIIILLLQKKYKSLYAIPYAPFLVISAIILLYR